MSSVLDALVGLLTLEPIEENLFRGQSQDLGWGTLYGGHVLGQALSAALQTVPQDRLVHSLHAYFLRPGDVARPVVYEVERTRDGGSFTTRRVVAIQHGHPILDLQASFQKDEPGFEHQDPMPEAPAPGDVPTEVERYAPLKDRLPPLLRERLFAEKAFDFRIVDGDDSSGAVREPERKVWMRTRGALPDGRLHPILLAYASDYAFVTTSLLPHGTTWLTPGMQVASLDHSLWFHRPFRADAWMLHVIESPSAQGARGIVRGRVFDERGRLVASTAQEGLIRKRPAPAR